VPWIGTPSILRELYNFEIPRPHLLVFEIDLSVFLSCHSIFVFLRSLLCFCACCCCVVLLCSCSYSRLTPILILIILCKVSKTPTFGDSSQNCNIRKNDGTQVLSLDHLRGDECNSCPLRRHNME
jgi:hypothetical protein